MNAVAAPIPVIVNAAAGAELQAEGIEELQGFFRAAGAEARVITARTGADLRAIVEREAREKPRIIVAGGGDGTINCVGSVLAGTGIALGVLPLGTLNHFAKDLGIPLDRQEAARTVVEGRAIDIDVGEVNGRVFLNNSSLGLYPLMVRQREHERRRLGRGKWSALLRATLNALRRSPFLHVRIHLDGKSGEYRTPFVFIGNNEYLMEGFDIGRRERLDAGHLSVYVTRRRGRWGLLGLGVRAVFGRLHQASDFEALKGQNIVVETRRRKLSVATDGEINPMQTPLEYAVRPRALRVIVPAAQTTKV